MDGETTTPATPEVAPTAPATTEAPVAATDTAPEAQS